jgi:hypothetical protein
MSLAFGPVDFGFTLGWILFAAELTVVDVTAKAVATFDCVVTVVPRYSRWDCLQSEIMVSIFLSRCAILYGKPYEWRRRV